MNERIKKVRETLDLTQEEFGRRIGSARNTIANYENGNRNPSNSVILSICREFNVNEDWLRSGEGEMFCKLETNDIVAKATRLLGEKDPMFEAFVETYSTLSPSDRKVLMDFGVNLVKSLNGKASD